MNKFIYGILMTIGVIVLSVVSALGVYDYKEKQFCETCTDTTEVINFEDAFVIANNPEILTVNDAVDLKIKVDEINHIDSVFSHMSLETVQTIAKVLIGRYQVATKATIVEEYEKSYESTYKFLDPSKLDPPDNEVEKVETVDVKPNYQHYEGNRDSLRR